MADIGSNGIDDANFDMTESQIDSQRNHDTDGKRPKRFIGEMRDYAIINRHRENRHENEQKITHSTGESELNNRACPLGKHGRDKITHDRTYRTIIRMLGIVIYITIGWAWNETLNRANEKHHSGKRPLKMFPVNRNVLIGGAAGEGPMINPIDEDATIALPIHHQTRKIRFT